MSLFFVSQKQPVFCFTKTATLPAQDVSLCFWLQLFQLQDPPLMHHMMSKLKFCLLGASKSCILDLRFKNLIPFFVFLSLQIEFILLMCILISFKEGR